MMLKGIFSLVKSLFGSGMSVKSKKKLRGNSLDINQKGMEVHGDYVMKIDNSYHSEHKRELSDE
ncbi:hypothetical protein ACLUXJ_09825 [Lactobacillus porci]|uniref:hypothetical protein n=1 Tax=Lactobacillus porci TaxID=2012477 RepID=UPI003992A1EA